MRIDKKNFDAYKYSMCVYQSCGIFKDSGQYSTLAPPFKNMALEFCENKFVYYYYYHNSNGANTAYICKHSACLHTQKCAHNVSTEILGP